MVKIRCVVETITYQNQENGYSVMRVKVKGYSELVTIVGSLLDVPVGAVLLCGGDWKVDPKYGRQFIVESWEEVMPSTVYGIEKYLGSGLVKGIGPRFAHLIVERFGTDTIEVIETDIERLHEVPGIGSSRVKAIRESWEKQKDIKNVMLFLRDHGVSTAFAAKIYRQYGKESVAVVKENPYRLADDIWGIGFKTADSIAKNMGYGPSDPRRCRSGLRYTLNELAGEGHVFALADQLVEAAKTLLEADGEPVAKALEEMVENKDLIQEEGAVYLPPFYHSEAGTARKLLSLLSSKSGNLFDGELDMAAVEKASGVRYDDIQVQAIKGASMAKVLVLTGGPGTGKTTTTQGIIAAFKSQGLKVLLAAPTGRAAKRMSEATGMAAKTIHRLLEFNPAEGYGRDENRPLQGDALIVDECSMIDIILMYNLLKAIPAHMRLVLVGDIDQLPSVGAGNVLRDIIESGIIPVVRLTRIFRQAQSSRIVMNAHAINGGKLPDISNGRDSDFFFIRCDSPEAASAEIVNLVKNRLPQAYRQPLGNIQVLTPMQRGVIGTANLNILLQQALNPTGDSVSRGGYCFRAGDRVMQVRNNYDKDVFNGDIGTVRRVDTEERTVTVDFDGTTAQYEASELDEIVLAYATTIHKSQGSEYPIVVIPVMTTHYVMLQRNLIYTAITRAKKICVLIGQTSALSIAINNLTVSKRNTRLKERLAGPFTGSAGR